MYRYVRAFICLYGQLALTSPAALSSRCAVQAIHWQRYISDGPPVSDTEVGQTPVVVPRYIYV